MKRGNWTRERYLAAPNETLSELAELDMSHPSNPMEDPEAITRLGAYVREVRTAWRDADKTQRRLLVRTLFEQIWLSKKIAQNLDGIENTGRLPRQVREVQTGGPDGTYPLCKRAR